MTADTALVIAMGGGDRFAFAELQRRYFLTLYAKAYSLMLDPAATESVVAQVFDEAWRNAATFQDPGPAAGGVHGWLLSLMHDQTSGQLSV